jgi:hypothetical protein
VSRPTHWLLLLVCCVLLAACARHAQSGTSLPAPHIAETERARIAMLARDMLARAERAQSDARAAVGDARVDHQTRADLLLAAAATEADRVVLLRRAAALEAEAQAADRTRVFNEQATVELRAQLQRARSAALATQEAIGVFTEVAAEERPRRPVAEQAAAHARASTFFLKRARLTLAVALALGAAAPCVATAQRELEAAVKLEAAHREALPAAQHALGAAYLALGNARQQEALPGPDMAADLAARVTELGLSAVRGPTGVVITVAGAFVSGGSDVLPTQRRRLVLLALLLSAYPHGFVVIAPGSGSAGSERLAQRRAGSARALLLPGPGLPRLKVPAEAAVGVAPDDLTLILPAYAMLAAQ